MMPPVLNDSRISSSLAINPLVPIDGPAGPEVEGAVRTGIDSSSSAGVSTGASLALQAVSVSRTIPARTAEDRRDGEDGAVRRTDMASSRAPYGCGAPVA